MIKQNEWHGFIIFRIVLLILLSTVPIQDRSQISIPTPRPDILLWGGRCYRKQTKACAVRESGMAILWAWKGYCSFLTCLQIRRNLFRKLIWYAVINTKINSIYAIALFENRMPLKFHTPERLEATGSPACSSDVRLMLDLQFYIHMAMP